LPRPIKGSRKIPNVSRKHVPIGKSPSYFLLRFQDNEVVRVGYARVSRKDQRLEAQRDALLADGCERVFEEKISSREAERSALREAFDYCRKGDVVMVVARLDRLGRSLRELIDLVGELEGKGVGFRSLKENLDTPTAGGRLIFHVFGALAEFEREIIRKRTLAGLESARARGRHGGRPPLSAARVGRWDPGSWASP